MQSVNTSWACGNYSVNLVADATPEQFQALANLGLRYLGQRNSNVDKILGGFAPTGKDGKLERIKGWKRSDVIFMPTLAEKLRDSFKELELSEGNKVVCEVGITEYVPSTTVPKFAEETEIVSRHESKGDLDEWKVQVVKYDGPTHTEDGESFNPGLLAAVREYKKAALKNI